MLAAGAGRRLGADSLGLPKVMVPVGGEPILLRLLRQLAAVGITRASVVVGAYTEAVRSAVEKDRPALDVRFVDNPDFAATNSSVSLELCRDVLPHGCLLAEGDIVTEEVVLRTLAAGAGTCWAVRRCPDLDGAFLQAGRDGSLERITIVKPGSPPPPDGFKSMGLLKLEPDYGARLRRWLAEEVAAGRRDRYFDLVIADHVKEAAPRLLEIEDGRWIEIDTPADLAEGRRLFGSPA